MIVPSYLFYGFLLGGERLLYLQHHILIDNSLDGVAGDALRHHVKVFGRDVEQFGVEAYVARLAVAVLQFAHKSVEEFLGAWCAVIRSALYRVAIQIVVESEEESLQLQQHQLVETGAALLLEVHT